MPSEADPQNSYQTDVSIPRFPRFMPVTTGAWFRTTVNPLVWDIVPRVTFPIPISAIMVEGRLREHGIYWEATQWAELAAASRLRSPALRTSQWTPASLLNPTFVARLFELLTSARKADHTRARQIFATIQNRMEGGLPQRSGGAHIFGPTRKRAPFREDVTRRLEAQLRVWEVAVGKSVRTPGSVARAVRPAVSEALARDHLAVLKDYVEFLKSPTPLVEAAKRLYPGLNRPEDVATASLAHAVKWLREK